MNAKGNKMENKFIWSLKIIELLESNKVKVKNKCNKTDIIHVKE